MGMSRLKFRVPGFGVTRESRNIGCSLSNFEGIWEDQV